MDGYEGAPSTSGPSLSSRTGATLQTDAPSLLPVPPLISPFFKEDSDLIIDLVPTSPDGPNGTGVQLQDRATDEQDAQERAEPSSEATLLQQQLRAAALRLSESISSNMDGYASNGRNNGRPRSASLLPPSSPPTIRPSLSTRHSSYTQRDGLAHQIDHDLAVARRRSSTPPPRSREASSSAPSADRSGPLSLNIPTPETPPSLKSTSSSPRRTSPRALLAPLRAIRRLSNIPASTAPLPTGMTRSHSSPPFLPSLTPTAPLSPLNLTFTPRTAGLAPTTQTHWPSLEQATPYQQATFSLSAPNLISTSVPEDTILAEPLDMAQEESSKDTVDLGAVFNEVEDTSRSAREDRHYHALLELVETETAYRDTLRTLVKVYFQTLPFLPMLSSADVEAVVRNAEALLDLHERIAARLQQVEAEIGWQSGKGRNRASQNRKVRKAAGRVARIFVDELPNFHLYDDFCARHSEAVDVIRAVAARPEWEAYERQCASRAHSSGSGDQTPLATQVVTSPFFASTPTLVASTPTLIGSPPSSPPLGSQPDPSTLPPLPASPLTSTIESSWSSGRSRLRYADFVIAPVQRICRYPLLFGAVLKNLSEGEEKVELEAAWEGLRKAAENVDDAKRRREGELRTRIVAARMEFLAPIGSAFCDVLGPTRLVGTLHFVHRAAAPEVLRVKYYGCFLYRTHLIIGKIKKRDSYEPREWLPLRLFDITNVEEGEGLLPHSIRLSHRDQHFDLGATCALEKVVWLNSLSVAQAEARDTWDNQNLDEEGHPTLFDETLVSSVSATPSPGLNATGLPRRNHVRTTSAVSMNAAIDRMSPPADEHSPTVPESPIIPALPQLVATASHASSHGHASDNKRHRFSTTASSLLGKAPAAQRAAIDLRLSDVFSEECLAARAQTMRESETQRLARGGSTAARTRTMSGPKRSMTAQAQASVRMLAKEKRRMSCVDLGTIEAQMMDYRGAVGFDADAAVVYHEPVGQKWGSSMRRGKGSNGGSKNRPVLPEIDTKLAETMRRSGTWGSKALRRAASHSSLQGRPTPTAPTLIATPSSATNLTADVERNNSVSSTTSSSGTGTNSSSSHSHGLLASGNGGGGSAYSHETPPSSIPPSPDLHTIDLEQLHTKLPSTNPPSAIPQSPRWGSQGFGEGVSGVFKVKRRSSALGLGQGMVPPASFAEEERMLAPPTPGLQRRASTKLGGFFSKRVQSSPTLSNLFASAMAHSPSPALPSTSRRAGLTSTSTPHLGIPAHSPPEGPGFCDLGPSSTRTSTSGGSTETRSGQSSPEIYTSRKPRSSSKGAMEREPPVVRPSSQRMKSLFRGFTPIN